MLHNVSTTRYRLLVYVDDLFITSYSEKELDKIDKTLREKYGGVTSQKGDRKSVV